MQCKKCSAVIQGDSVFCPVCGAKVGATYNPSSAFRRAGDLSGEAIAPLEMRKATEPAVSRVMNEDKPACDKTACDKPISDKPADNGVVCPRESCAKSDNGINYVSLAVLAVCAIMWFAAPFMAINLLTFGDQPTALELLQDDVLHIGDISESAAYKAAMISAIGIVLCLIFILCRCRTATRLAAAAALLPLVKTIIDVARWADNAEEIMDFIGAAYGCIVVGFLIVLFAGRGTKSQSNAS